MSKSVLDDIEVCNETIDMEKLYEFVARITYSVYYNHQSNYGIYEFTSKEKLPCTSDYLTGGEKSYIGCLCGNMQELMYETDYKVKAKLKYNAKYKKYDYSVENILCEQPKTPSQQQKFLEVMVTQKQASTILNIYPNAVEDILQGKKLDCNKLSGIGEKTLNKIEEKILDNYIIQDVLVLLRPLGITYTTIKKMLNYESNPSLLKQKLEENPYILTSIHGLGFKKVDDLALKLSPDLRVSTQRAKAYLSYKLKSIANSEGHTWLKRKELIGYIRKDLKECVDIYKDIISKEQETPRFLYIDEDRVGLLYFYNKAKGIVEQLNYLDSIESMLEPFTEEEMDSSIAQTEEQLGFKFTEEQVSAIKSVNERNVIIITAPAGAGKEQPLDSKILTPTGWTTMGEVNINDEVVGDDGNTYNVTGIFPQGEKDVYELVFSDGSKAECGLEHLWDIKLYGDRCTYNKYITKSLKEILNDTLYDIEKSGYKRWKYYIPMTKPVNFANDNKQLPIDPYILGLLIGDGCFVRNNIIFTNPEDDLIKHLSEHVASMNMVAKIRKDFKDNHCTEVTIRDKDYSNKDCYFIKKLTELHLINKLSYEKFIPREYLCSDIKNRIDLLSGLIDTDGEVDNSGYVYSTTSYQLALDVQFLTHSLGGTAKIENRQTYFTYKNEKKRGLPSYRLNIKMPRDIQIFKSKKHLNKFKLGQTKARRTIRKINYVGKKECQCIMVSAPNHRYITDDFIVTHNTTTVKGMFNLLSTAKIKEEFLHSEFNQIHERDQFEKDELDLFGDTIASSYSDISAIDDLHVIKIGQSALSAKAAKRMKELSGQPASTMHRMLEYDGEGFGYDKNSPMKYHVNIWDEASMVNKSLTSSYLNAIRPHSKLVIIFDFAQLPPIGSGDFTRDLLDSQFCINKFTKVHRQGEESGILMDANKIRVGINPIEKFERQVVHGALKDMYYVFDANKEKMRDLAIKYYLKSVEDVGLDEAVIVTPRKSKSTNSSFEINKIIQDKLLPNSPYVTRWKDGEKCLFKLGAKVMQKKNNYDTNVFNGDEGYITAVDKSGINITFNEEWKEHIVRYSIMELDQIELSYAISVHSGQGSQYHSVICVFDMSSYIMLNRRILYTAITRARKKCMLISEPRAFKACLDDENNVPRQTFLAELLNNKI